MKSVRYLKLRQRVTEEANVSFKNRFPYISLTDEASCQIWHAAGVCQDPSSNPIKIKSACGPELGELPEIWSYPFNTSGTAEASDFKFGTHHGFAKAHHKITPRGKRGGGIGLGELPNILGFPYNISATAGASDFKFGAKLGFDKAHQKITRRRKGGHGPGLGSSQNLGFPFGIYTMAEARKFKFGTQLGFARPTIKPHPEDK